MPKQTPRQTEPKLNPAWVRQAKRHFRTFLRETGFPEPDRNGSRGSTFDYPEWLIMFIAVLAAKAKVKTYLGIHRLTVKYWSLITPRKDLPPISESQLRDRLKKISYQPGRTPGFISQIFSRQDLQ